jgi:hypothetical protein
MRVRFRQVSGSEATVPEATLTAHMPHRILQFTQPYSPAMLYLQHSTTPHHNPPYPTMHQQPQQHASIRSPEALLTHPFVCALQHRVCRVPWWVCRAQHRVHHVQHSTPHTAALIHIQHVGKPMSALQQLGPCRSTAWQDRKMQGCGGSVTTCQKDRAG